MHGTFDRKASARSADSECTAEALPWIAWLELCFARRRERRALQRLDDDRLRDIGLSRADVERECQRWPWDGRPNR